MSFTLEETRERAVLWEEQIRADSPMYSRLARRVAADDELLALLQEAAPGQPQMNLLLGAVQYLLLGDRGHPLAAWYPSLGGNRAAGLEDEFARFVADHREAVATLIATRRVQTNEVGRAAFLLPAYNLVNASAGQPIALIEIGTSAGLTQNLDRFGYRYRSQQGAVELAPDSPVVLDCDLEDRIPEAMNRTPEIAWRLGVDLHPIDIGDDDQMRWLQALLWPDLAARHQRLVAAIEIARDHPPTVVAGDARDALPELVAAAPPETAVVIQHSWVLNQIARPNRARLFDLLDGLAAGRPIYRVGAEALTRPPLTTLDLTVHGPSRESRTLAEVHHHGTWIRWED